MAGVNVGTAYLEIIPSARGFAGKLQGEVGNGMAAAGRRAGKDAADGFASKFSSGIKSTAKYAAVGLGVGFAAVGALGGAGLKMGLDIAAGNEQAQISFTTMLGSAQKAGAFLGQLQKFAAATPFEFPELQTAASSLISAGINADKVVPIMRTLGDVTAGMGTGSEGIQRATVALQQMSAAGKISGEDLNQLRDAGIPVYDLLSKATGKSKAQVVALAQAGKLGSKELGQMMSALETGKGLERFSGLMDKQSQSLTGLISTFKDTLGQGLAKTVQPLIPMIKSGLGGASNFLAGALPKVASGLLRVVKGAQGLYDVLIKGHFSKQFREAFHVEEDSPVVGFLLKVRDGFKATVAAVQDFAAGLTLKDAGDIGAPLEGFVAVGQKVRTVAVAAFGYLKTTAVPAVKNLIDQFKTGQGTGGQLRDSFTKIWDAAQKLWPSIKQIGTQLAAASKSGGVSTFTLLKAAVAALPGILDKLAPALQGVAKWMGENKDIVNLLVPAYGAFKVATLGFKGAMLAASAVQAANLFILKAQTVGTVEHLVVSKTAAVATKVWAAAQWLMNAALDANPIGIVVIAIAALVAGLIYAYQNSETFRAVVDTAFHAIADAGRWLWNKVLAPVIRFIVGGFGDVADKVGDFLDALSNIPGFGWAKDAANKMHGAADKAREMAKAITDIPDDKQIKIETTYVYKEQGKALASQNDRKLAANGIDGKRASGGPVSAGGTYLVGEREPELFVPNVSGTIMNQAQIAHAAGVSGGIDYDRLAFAMSRVQVNANVSPSALDRTAGVR